MEVVKEMKFEIDDETGMIGTAYLGSYFLTDDSKELEQILQAVKKTQVKLVNKQIQYIQDSKNPSQEQMLSNSEVKINGEYISYLKIEQNQKIVNEIIRIHYNKEEPRIPPIISNFMSAIVETATGKDIEDI